MLVAGTGTVKRPKLIGAIDAQSELNSILNDFFGDLYEGANPRAAIRLTMGMGKTNQTVAHLKNYLEDKYHQKIEVYVPRYDIADEWQKSLEASTPRSFMFTPVQEENGMLRSKPIHTLLCVRGLIMSEI